MIYHLSPPCPVKQNVSVDLSEYSDASMLEAGGFGRGCLLFSHKELRLHRPFLVYHQGASPGEVVKVTLVIDVMVDWASANH